jgi:hypothetical protein
MRGGLWFIDHEDLGQLWPTCVGYPCRPSCLVENAGELDRRCSPWHVLAAARVSGRVAAS